MKFRNLLGERTQKTRSHFESEKKRGKDPKVAARLPLGTLPFSQCHSPRVAVDKKEVCGEDVLMSA